MISEVIKKIRVEHNLTQKELADQLFVSDKTISSWENDRTIPDIYMLEKISNLYHMHMNDLMAGNVNKLSILKYRFRKFYVKTLRFIKAHFFMSVIIFIAVLSSVLFSVLPALYAYLYLNTIILSAIMTMTIKYSKWYSIAFFIPLSVFAYDLILIINPKYYGSIINENRLTLLDIIIGYGFIIALGFSIGYFIYLLIKKIKYRFYHLSTIVMTFLWIPITVLYEPSIPLSLHYSSFTDQWTYNVVKSSNFGLLMVFIMMGICIVFYIQQLLNNYKEEM